MHQLSIKLYPRIFNPEKDLFIQYSNPDPDRDPLKVYFSVKKYPDPKERLAAANEMLEKIKAEWQPLSDSFHPDLLRDLSEIVQLRCMGKRRKTDDSYNTYFNGFVEWYSEKGRMLEKHQVGIQFGKHLLLNKKNNTTHNNYRRGLRSFFKDLLEYYPDKYDCNPFDSTRVLPENSATKQYFRLQQMQAIKKAILDSKDEQLWIGCQLQYYCFIRPIEQKDLRIENINFETKKIQVPGKTAKNSNTEYVPIPEPLFEWLLPFKSLPADWYIFSATGCPGEKKIGRDTLSKRHAKILKKLGFRKGYSYYSWKNTGAVELIKKGVHMKTISMLMRHSSIDITDQYLKSLGISDLIEHMMITYTTI